MTTPSLSPFWRGVLDFLPLLPGVVPFAAIAGIAALQAGLTPTQASGMSLIVYAGSAQLVACSMIAAQVPPLLIVATSAIVNLRFAMYSASMTPHLASLPAPLKLLGAYGLTDQSYALAMTRTNPRERTAPYYLGASLIMWLTWQLGTLAGALLGARIPPAWSLEFTVALSFIALAVPTVKDKATLLAALTAGLVAVATAGLPYRLNLIIGTLVGIAVGMAARRWARSRRQGTP
ncbi:AzlC family ABC transporter permease [Deinococcus peraridilitoris]|uniref:Putative branched-chain amino acid permease (Azaleucine resistance) n=1 Tax=Deinococcus peraridilitoris (strain DSM 19664 / LMG 22246 / CIP 109416 / KR-200) TaxID=937777 RepID=L0A178_DEIPD|nr:AzlC family ABC transporter permease [Deinococcus peraridilitoris]AFZ67209.1 putative branched-chain amino acid permease (azaleucine resistance) [Deinococcus peraridilitoris DSM 19664]